MTLKAELTRSIEVVLAGNHFVAELSTGFEKSLIYRYQLLAFAFDDQSGGILILSKKKKSQAPALSLPPFLPLYKAMELCSFLSCRKKRKKKKEEGQREDLSAAEKTDICAFWYKPFGLHFVSSSLLHLGLKAVLFIRGKESTCAKQQMTGRRGVFFSLHVTPPLWGCGAPSIRWGNFPS